MDFLCATVQDVRSICSQIQLSAAEAAGRGAESAPLAFRPLPPTPAAARALIPAPSPATPALATRVTWRPTRALWVTPDHCSGGAEQQATLWLEGKEEIGKSICSTSKSLNLLRGSGVFDGPTGGKRCSMTPSITEQSVYCVKEAL